MLRSLPRPFDPSALDARRIVANTGVVLLHVLAFAVLMLPSRWDPPVPAVRPAPPVVIEEFIEPEPIKLTEPPPIPIQIPRERPAPLDPPSKIAPVPFTESAPVFDSGEIQAMPGDDAGPPVDSFEPGPPQLTTLAYDVYPAPRYPRLSIRAGDEGRVLLRVLVDEHGYPQEVLIERGSGHRELDRAAREQVLKAWRFHPAQREGRTVAAWALVPIDFTLP
jgi:protein TonB